MRHLVRCRILSKKKVRSFHQRYRSLILEEVLSAIAHVHSLGIVYRDLKPDKLKSATQSRAAGFGSDRLWDRFNSRR